MTNSKSVDSFDGVRIEYDSYDADDGTSAKSALVFVHGWTCNRTHWRRQVSEFSGRFRVVAIDLAGHGDSGFGRENYSMPSFARDVEAVLNHEQIDSAVLIGHSMGGMVIVHAAHLLKERVVGLVGADTFKFLRDDPKTGKQAEQWKSMVADYDAAAPDLIGSMFTNTSPLDLVQDITDGMLSTSRETAIGAMKGMADDVALFEPAASLDIPKFALNAEGRHMDEDAVRDAAIELRFVPTMGHFVMVEDPIEFNRLLEEALSQMFT